MSGHSKWSTIKRQKGVNDAKRGAVFTRMANAIMIAVKEGGGGDPETNFRLRLVLDQARAANLPKDNISRAIDKALGKGGGPALESILYEGFGPNSVAILVEVITDNRNRIGAEVKSTIEKSGGSLGGPGAVAWMFEKKGLIEVDIAGEDPDEFFLKACDMGAEDVVVIDNTTVQVLTKTTELKKVEDQIRTGGYNIRSSDFDFVAKVGVKLEDIDKVRSVLGLFEKLEDLSDVVKVSSNLDIPDSMYESL
jgi:YebC/PmpR family DNA-binding regulatory protein